MRVLYGTVLNNGHKTTTKEVNKVHSLVFGRFFGLVCERVLDLVFLARRLFFFRAVYCWCHMNGVVQE